METKKTCKRKSVKDPSGHELNFEEALARLETTVQALESGNLSLDQSLALFEEGIKLTRRCTSLLNEAEKKMGILLATSNGMQEISKDYLEAKANG